MSREDNHAHMSMPPHTKTKNTTPFHNNLFLGKNVVVLFQGWPNNDLGMYILALVFVFWISVAVEVLSVPPAVKPGKSPVVGGLSQASVYGLRMVFGYMVMLSVMSFNVGVLVLAVLGHAFGAFLVKRRVVVAAATTTTTARAGVEAAAKANSPIIVPHC